MKEYTVYQGKTPITFNGEVICNPDIEFSTDEGNAFEYCSCSLYKTDEGKFVCSFYLGYRRPESIPNWDPEAPDYYPYGDDDVANENVDWVWDSIDYALVCDTEEQVMQFFQQHLSDDELLDLYEEAGFTAGLGTKIKRVRVCRDVLVLKEQF